MLENARQCRTGAAYTSPRRIPGPDSRRKDAPYEKNARSREQRKYNPYLSDAHFCTSHRRTHTRAHQHKMNTPGSSSHELPRTGRIPPLPSAPHTHAGFKSLHPRAPCSLIPRLGPLSLRLDTRDVQLEVRLPRKRRVYKIGELRSLPEPPVAWQTAPKRASSWVGSSPPLPSIEEEEGSNSSV